MTRPLYHDLLSCGFDAGNYASAYYSVDLDTGWLASKENFRRFAVGRANYEERAFRAAFVIGFFSAYEVKEIPSRYLAEWSAAMTTEAEALRGIGIGV